MLHQIGAHDSYISRRFEGHFVRLTLLAALSGTLAACLFFYLFGTILPDARNSDLYIWLLPVPSARFSELAGTATMSSAICARDYKGAEEPLCHALTRHRKPSRAAS